MMAKANNAGDDQHRDRIDIGAVDACDRIGPARPGRDVHQRHPLRQSGVCFRSHRQCLLVVAKGRLDLGMRADRVVKVHRAAAGQHERVADAVGDELVRHPMRQFNFGHSLHPFHRAVRTIASSMPTVGTTPNSFLIFFVAGT